MSNISVSIADTIANGTSPVLDINPVLGSELSIHNRFFLKYPLVPYSIVSFYILFVEWIGPEMMKYRKPYSLQKVLIVYNLLQAFANLCIAYTAIDGIIKYWDSHCLIRNSPKLQEMLEAALTPAYNLYIIKFIDLLDTVFFVLRKKQSQVSFLHVFHHAGMCLIYYWGLSILYKAPGFYMAVGFAINTVVHVIMYTYYGLSAIGPKMQKYLWWKKHLTRLQIGQIFFILSYMLYGFLTGCEEFGNMEFYGFAYGSITLLLFLNFYRKYKQH
ncbi:Elongation of very long chain fatty acids like protein [Argiope bruennichi]|uniref:Elongation of very long chain fatty acids protein n=1 Tax=Argiope bruennichi TaxID=94029 RepID=A0A8T0EZW0_ARGBR|nr:Elongation of very long chain fatty acids like protein [Argiope bruennichi]